MPRKPKIHGHETIYTKLQKNYCFACGQNNPDGMRLKFTLDEERQTFVCRFRLGKRYTGPPGHCHGGIIATILDDAMGKVNKLRHVIALTQEMTVEYLKPVPLHKPLKVEGREVERPWHETHQRRRNHQRKRRSPRPQPRNSSSPSTPKKCSENPGRHRHDWRKDGCQLSAFRSSLTMSSPTMSS